MLALVALPLALLAVNSTWLFSAIDRDDWMYYGLFRGAPAYLRLFSGNPAYYQASRLSVILPGWLLADSPQVPTVTLSDNWPGRTTGLALFLVILPGSLLAIWRQRHGRAEAESRFGWLAQVRPGQRPAALRRRAVHRAFLWSEGGEQPVPGAGAVRRGRRPASRRIPHRDPLAAVGRLRRGEPSPGPPRLGGEVAEYRDRVRPDRGRRAHHPGRRAGFQLPQPTSGSDTESAFLVDAW